MRGVVGGLIVSLIMAAPAAAGQPWHHGGAHWRSWEVRASGRAMGCCRFRPADVRIVREYDEPWYRWLPPGLAKKYSRTGRLPPGWAKRVEPLPPPLERRLVVLPSGCRRRSVGGTLFVYSPATGVLIDIVALPGR